MSDVAEAAESSRIYSSSSVHESGRKNEEHNRKERIR
jgi:hypothetical protein